MTCPVPLAISNGYYVGAKVSYTTGDVIQYVCNTDYVMSGSPVATCDASGNWTLASGTLPECNNSYFTNVWFLLVVSLMGFIALVVLSVLIAMCCRLCCKSRIYDEKSESDGRRACCGCCTCCSSADDDNKPSRPVKRKPRGVPVNKATTKKSVTKKKVVSKRGNMFRGKKGGKKVKKGTNASENTSSNSRKAKKVAAWKPFANPVRNINTSTK